MKPKKNIKLSDLTTIKLGGLAAEFVVAKTVAELKDALQYADKKRIFVWILSGGSNTVFKDEGFDGLVIKVDIKGISFKKRDSRTDVIVGAGESWDDVVKKSVAKKLVGIEALSGIPGSAGATPIQNVGAYGQEVADVITEVKALNRKTLEIVAFSKDECAFGYRMSRFKGKDAGAYIITEVTYSLFNDASPVAHYPQLVQKLEELFGTAVATPSQVRKAVLALRKAKSMVLDSRDANTQSCGSFFTNPVLSQKEFAALTKRWHASRGPRKLRSISGVNIRKAVEVIPFFETDDHRIKVPAAWLIEQSGFQKGHAHGGVGISERHTLALVNRNGTSRELLEFANVICRTVKTRFGIALQREPIIAD